MSLFRVTLLAFCAIFFGAGCATKSTFKIEPDENRNDVFQYCGGGQWGYSRRIPATGSNDTDPYLAVLMTPADGNDFDIRAIIELKAPALVTFENQWLRVSQNSQTFIRSQPFEILRIERPLHLRFKGKINVTRVPDSPNEYFVQEQKYGGAFGDMALEDPVRVKFEDHPPEPLTSNSIAVAFGDNRFGEYYIVNKARVRAASLKSGDGINVRTPAFKVNDLSVPELQYTFHYDADKLRAVTTETTRCAGLEELFRFQRLNRSWIRWIRPRIVD